MTIPTPKFRVGQLVFKREGEYHAYGTVLGTVRTSQNRLLVVFEFEAIPGLIHLFREHQLEAA